MFLMQPPRSLFRYTRYAECPGRDWFLAFLEFSSTISLRFAWKIRSLESFLLPRYSVRFELKGCTRERVAITFPPIFAQRICMTGRVVSRDRTRSWLTVGIGVIALQRCEPWWSIGFSLSRLDRFVSFPHSLFPYLSRRWIDAWVQVGRR